MMVDMPPNSLRDPKVGRKMKSPKKKFGHAPWFATLLRQENVLELWDEIRANSQVNVQDKVNLHKQGKKVVNAKLNTSGVVDLVQTTSNTSFTQPTTFRKRHHSSPYNILFDSPQGLHSNGILSQDSQVGVPKLGLLLF